MGLGTSWSARAFAGLVLLLSGAMAFSQTPAPLDSLNVPIGLVGSVAAMAQQPDGGLIVGGRFTMIDGVLRNRIARITPSGLLDKTWNPSLDGEVFALAVNADGDVYVGGAFTRVNGQRHELVAKLSGKGTGAVDAEWNPGFAEAGTQEWQHYRVKALALDGRGFLFAGGNFRSINGQQHANLAKVSTGGRGNVDANWRPDADEVITLALDRQGAVYAATEGLDWYRLLIFKFSGTGSGLPASDWNPTIKGGVASLAIGPDDALYAAGRFSIPNEPSRSLVKFPASGKGAISAGWHPGTAGSPAFDNAGSLYVSNGAGVTKLSAASGNVDAVWTASANGAVHVLMPMADGTLYAGGEFDGVAGREAASIARLAASNGASSPTVGAQVPGEVTAVARQADGALIVGGHFQKIGTATRKNLLRLAADGTLDLDWNPSFDSVVQALAVDGDGDVYVVPQIPYNSYHCRLAKFSGSGHGDVDPGWNPDLFGPVYAMATDAHDHVYAVGDFFYMTGTTYRYGLARMSRFDATLDPQWIPDTNGTVRDIVVDDTGAIYTSVIHHVDSRSYSIAKYKANSATAELEWDLSADQATALAIGPDGALDAAIATHGDPGINEIMKIARDGIVEATWTSTVQSGGPWPHVSTLAVGADHAIYVGGHWFQGSDLPPRSLLMKLSADLHDTIPDWNPAPDGMGISALVPGVHGGVLAGGDFSVIGGQSRAGMAVLPSETPWTSPPRMRAPPILLPPIRRTHP